MINRRLRVGLVCNKDFFESDIEDSQVARLREFAEFRWKEMNEPTGWEEMPDSSKETEAELVTFDAHFVDIATVCPLKVRFLKRAV